MADEKIYPDMPDIGAPGSADVLPIVRPGDTTNYSITMDGIAAYAQGALIPGAGMVYSTGSAFDTATMGDGVAFASGTLDNTGVLQTGSLTGSIALGSHMTTAGGSLDATGFAAVPSAGIVYSNGTILSAAVMGDGVAESGGTLSNTGVLSVGTLTGAVGLGANLTTTGGTLNATGFGSMSSWVAGTNLSGGTITNGGTASLSPAITITDSTAKIVLDRNTGGTLDTLGTVYMQVVGVNGGAVRDVIDTFGAVGQFVTRRADGTRASKTAVQNGDTIGTFGAVGYDGTNYSTGGIASATPQTGMSAVANQNWSSSARGVNLVFFGIANAGTTIANFGTMASTGLVLAGGTLSTAGNAMVLGGNFSTAGALTFSGANAVTFTSTGATSLTLPTSGTLSTTTGTVTQIIANGALSGGTITSTGTVGLAVSTGLTISAAGTIATQASTRVFTFSFDVGNTGTFAADTYKAKMEAAGVVLNAYVVGGTGGTITVIPQIFVVTSGTIGAGANITGLGTLTSGGSLTVETAGTATAANTFAIGDYVGFVGAISSGTPVGTKVNISGTYSL